MPSWLAWPNVKSASGGLAGASTPPPSIEADRWIWLPPIDVVDVWDDDFVVVDQVPGRWWPVWG
jgi:hypothetical protein